MEKQGFLVFFDENRRKDLIQIYIDGKIHTFSEALSISDWPIKEYDIAFFSFNMKTIEYISLARKRSKVVTSKNKIEFTEIVNLNSIEISEINKRMEKSIQNYFIKSSQGNGEKLTKKTFQELIEIIKTLRPELREDIDFLLNKKILIDKKFNDIKKTEIFLQEKDALGTALDIFSGNNQLRKEVFNTWSNNNESILQENSYFKGLNKNEYKFKNRLSFLSHEKKSLSEEDTLQHDLFNWPGMSSKHISGHTTFSDGIKKLDVFYANRNALEKTIGVDLIYYNERYNSFVLIQYKLMEKELEGFIYRPDKQFDDEINRMNNFNSKIALLNTINRDEDMRLNNNGFMFKLTPNKNFEPIGEELISGMYLTLDYTNFLMGSNGPKGKKGGKLISYQNSPRYLNNTDFMRLVSQGFIGTNNIQSTKIQELIKEFYETNRAVIFAKDNGL